jgi:hypothetical protein
MGAETTACTQVLAWVTRSSPRLKTNGTYEPSLVKVHAREICAILAPRLFAISSTLMGARYLPHGGSPPDHFLVAGLFEVQVAVPATPVPE